MELLLSAVLMGLMGSFHCVGMCGPIALALPLQGNSITQKIIAGILYNLGRAFTYAIMGLLFGLVGQSIKLLGFQQWVSIIMGAIMILTVITPSLFKHFRITRVSFFTEKVRKGIQRLFSQKSYTGLFFIGSLNGLLPCGLVYLAMAASIASASAFLGSAYMLAFGLATIPMMLFISIMGNVISQKVRAIFQKVIPVIVVIVGIIFILRGLCIGIPFLSPSEKKLDTIIHPTEQTKNCEHSCCHGK